MTLVPVSLVTGFLGSGKTTLLRDILSDPRSAMTAVIINEFGEIGLDGDLVAHNDTQVVETTTGCLCCTIRGDIRNDLLSLYERRALGAIPPFQRAIVETTGLADPAPVLHALMRDRRLDGLYALADVVAVVDAVNGDAVLDRHAEALKQVAMADRLVLSKTDLARDPASREDLEQLRVSLQRLNPGAPIVDRNGAGFDPTKLFPGATLYDPDRRSATVRAWLDEEDRLAGSAHADHEGHVHDVNRHGAAIETFALTFERPLSGRRLHAALQILVANHGERLLRVKGIANVEEQPERPFVFHGVRHVFHEPARLAAWPSDDRRSRLVFVTEDLPCREIEILFGAVLQTGVPSARTPA